MVHRVGYIRIARRSEVRSSEQDGQSKQLHSLESKERKVLTLRVLNEQESARVVSKQEGQNFALSKGALFKEVSAKRNEGVQEVFDKLVDEVGFDLILRWSFAKFQKSRLVQGI